MLRVVMDTRGYIRFVTDAVHSRVTFFPHTVETMDRYVQLPTGHTIKRVSNCLGYGRVRFVQTMTA